MSSGSANDVRRGTLRRRESSLKWFAGFLFLCLTSHLVLGQGAVKLPEEEQKQKEQKLVSKEQEQIAQQANLEIRGNTAFDDNDHLTDKAAMELFKGTIEKLARDSLIMRQEVQP